MDETERRVNSKMPTVCARDTSTGLVHRMVIILTDYKRCESLCRDHVVYVFDRETPWRWTLTDVLPVTCARCAVMDVPDADP